MRLNATGLGIGTTSPTSKLDIRQSTSGGSDVLGTGAITIGSDNPYWTLRGTATSLQDLAFDRNYSGTWYESMRIQRSTGNIGIGTTSPTAKLHVVGTGNFTGLVSGITPVNAANFVTKAYVDGSGGGTGPFLPLAGGTMTGTAGVVFPDSFKLNLGTGSDLEILHDGADSIINNNLGHLYITQTADDKDIIFRSDNGSGGVTEYLFLDGSQTNVNFQKDAIFTDGIKALFGGSGDLQIYHDGSNSYVNEVGAGDLYLQTNGTNMFLRDNSSGNTFIAMNTGTADVVLKQGGATRLTTTSTGVTVTGAATATTFLGDLNGTINTATTAVTKANATNELQ